MPFSHYIAKIKLAGTFIETVEFGDNLFSNLYRYPDDYQMQNSYRYDWVSYYKFPLCNDYDADELPHDDIFHHTSEVLLANCV